MSIEQALARLNLTLPAAPEPVGAYAPAVSSGKWIMTSGQLPLREGKLLATGKVPTEVSVEQAYEAARQAALNALAAVKAHAGRLDDISRILRVNVFVASEADFADQAKVANGASEMLVEVFGEAGRHTRCAIGVAALPLHSPVELDMTVELR